MKFEFRNLNLTDANWFNYCRNQARFFLHDSRFFTVNQTKKFLEQYAINYKAVLLNNFPIGYMRFKARDLGIKSNVVAEIGLDLLPEYQGKKFAKQIYFDFFKYCKNEKEVSKFQLKVLKTNTRATKLYFYLGFKIINESTVDFTMELDSF